MMARTAARRIGYCGKIWSSWWLPRYRFGPMEWLWRGMTYGKWPAMRKPPELAIEPSPDVTAA